MAESYEANEMPNRNDRSETYEGYLNRAVQACDAGDLVLGMHLYLAAYEKAVVDPAIPDGMALTGLQEAWQLACQLKERSMAEYVFEKLEPYLTGPEIAACAQRLQDLALDRLEQYGFSREELEGMAEMITQDLASEGSVIKVESITIPSTGLQNARTQTAESSIPDAAMPTTASPETAGAQAAELEATLPEATDQPIQEQAKLTHVSSGPPKSLLAKLGFTDEGDSDQTPPKDAKPFKVSLNNASPNDFNPYEEYQNYSIGKSYHAATNEGAGAHVFTRDEDRIKAAREAFGETENEQGEATTPTETPAQSQTQDQDQSQASSRQTAEAPVHNLDETTALDHVAQQSQHSPGALETTSKTPVRQNTEIQPGVLAYGNLAGYDETISIMRDFGIGLQNDRGFLSFVSMLNERHGLNRAPSLDTMLFRAPAIEDANRFVEATIGEIGLPVLQMSMEDGMQGVPMLCVTTQGNHRPRMNHAHNRFEAPAILVIVDLDSWVVPEMPENAEGMSGFLMANVSRGAREAFNMIRSAVEDPDVFVLATASTSGEVDPFFYDLLDPLTVVDIGYPNEKERIDIWTEIAHDHPSMRMVNRADLMRYSEGLPRYDIYMAAREAVEEAYKIGLVRRSYVPVTPDNIFEKLAAFQPLDSEAYRILEDEVIRNFSKELDQLDDLINN